MQQITQILNAIEEGKQHNSEELLPLVYDELRRLARSRLANQRPGQTLQATALVHEAYVQLVENKESRSWDSRGHFFAAAASAMRNLLVDNARRKGRQKRGGDRQRVEIDVADVGIPEDDSNILALDEALDRLVELDSRAAQLVNLRYFAGLTIKEAASSLDISLTTAKRDWSFARAWLRGEVFGDDPTNDVV